MMKNETEKRIRDFVINFMAFRRKKRESKKRGRERELALSINSISSIGRHI